MSDGTPKNERRKGFSFIGGSRKEILKLDETTRKRIGHQLDQVQQGLDPDDFKPRNDIGSGAMQISVNDENGNDSGRCIYVARFNDRVYVLHAFVKKSNETSNTDVETAKQRYKAMLAEIKEEQDKKKKGE